ncbi:5-oxoprolinase subunit PxpB [Bacillus sp. B15-48]|uniref:5-oxoprolinase subunit PxpB n=1 Tax=Bacillus sp. B15-48 TaxID=1548601 RepID=UPI00193FB3F1|nr:5-oxoprolinase subunit PxpB [Bacillus sp. B15-48]MBM4760937.1 5-oxoprolinase subunit PxpB [Bacillus sp. B15-48]
MGKNDCKVMVTGEKSIRFQFGNRLDEETYQKVREFSKLVTEDSSFLIEEIVPSYHTVTVYLKKEQRNIDEIIARYVKKWRERKSSKSEGSIRKLTIPVCYDEEFGWDLERVAEHTGLTVKEIIDRHTKPIYTVYMIGFLPGFSYLGKLDENLTTPRLATPRLKVLKGAVGIGGSQTGIYPLESPGGWNIIGKTPLELYRLDRDPPFFIEAGDRLRFVSIPKREFYEIKQRMEADSSTISEFIAD